MASRLRMDDDEVVGSRMQMRPASSQEEVDAEAAGWGKRWRTNEDVVSLQWPAVLPALPRLRGKDLRSAAVAFVCCWFVICVLRVVVETCGNAITLR